MGRCRLQWAAGAGPRPGCVSTPQALAFTLRLGLAITLLALAGCGGGGGGGSPSASGGGGSQVSQPKIVAAVLTFPLAAVPPGFLPPGVNSAATVELTDQNGNAITNASVSIDGTALVYVPADVAYEGTLTISPGTNVTLDASIEGVAYTASRTNLSTYPTITAPAVGVTWSSQSSNLVSWSGSLPDSSSEYALGILDTSGNLLWPSNGALYSVPSGDSSYVIASDTLPAEDELVLVGIVGASPIAAAAGGSGLLVGGFTYVPVTVSAASVATPESLAASPAVTVGLGKSDQLTATATYSDGSQQDVTTRASWSSSDATKVTVDATGNVTAVAGGSATVTAQFSGLMASTVVTVFQTNPSPPPPLSQAVAYQIDYAHSGRATVGAAGPMFPPAAHWSATLSGSSTSYPVIAGGMVFVTTNAAPAGMLYGTTLYALDETSGDSVWGPVPLSGTYSFSAIAYDHGTLFVVNFDGLLRTYDAASGTPGWSLQLPATSTVLSAPTAVNGVVYVTGDGGTIALDETNGNVISVGPGGDHSSPAVSSDGVFVSGPCLATKADPISSIVIWRFAEACSGGGGKTVAYVGSSVYVRDLFDTTQSKNVNLILDAASGVQTGMFSATVIPAFSATTGYFMTGGVLTATDLSTGNTVWTFTGDGNLISAPIVIDNTVVIGSSSGTVYALDANSGAQVWSGSAGAPIAGPDEQNAYILTGLGAGDGYLVVPAGNVLNGWRIVP